MSDTLVHSLQKSSTLITLVILDHITYDIGSMYKDTKIY